jgi:hypothetical protein
LAEFIRNQKEANELVLSFLSVRQALGLLGIILPLSLIGYSLYVGEPIRPSISDYFSSGAREIFVGCLFAIAVFLWAYKGYTETEPPKKFTDRFTDFNVSRAASLGALGAALAPVSPADPCPILQCAMTDWTPYVHYAGALLFFSSMTIFCLVLFTRGSTDGGKNTEKVRKNMVFKTSGWILATSTVLLLIIGAYKNFGPKDVNVGSLIFWIESAGVFAFGIAWIIKGQAIRVVSKKLLDRGGMTSAS